MRKYKSEIYQVLHEEAIANFEVGAISEARLRESEKQCFVDEPEPAYQTEHSEDVEHAGSVTA
jgi:DNA-binding transcriptional regulator YiaG